MAAHQQPLPKHRQYPPLQSIIMMLFISAFILFLLMLFRAAAVEEHLPLPIQLAISLKRGASSSHLLLLLLLVLLFIARRRRHCANYNWPITDSSSNNGE